MNSNNVVAQSSLLKEMVKIKKLRFKDVEERRYTPKLSRDELQRRANFEEFKAVYEDGVKRRSSLSINNEGHEVHKTKSGSLYRFSSVKKEPQYVETINIELPLNFGADRAVQVIGNKIKPRKAPRIPKAIRKVITEKTNPEIPIDIPPSPQPVIHKPQKTVTIMDKLNVIEEVAQLEQESLTKVTEKQIKEIEKHLKVRKDRMHKSLPKPIPVTKLTKKKIGNEKIMNTLSNINEKLQKMQEKYFNIPRIHYKNVNDCFTQSEDLEILYENKKYPEDVRFGDAASKFVLPKMPDNLLSDSKMQERIKEMNEMFPEFPKIEDTLREIECHLDNIVKLEGSGSNRPDDYKSFAEDRFAEELTKMWNGTNLTEILETLGQQSQMEDSLTEEILEKRRKFRDEKLRSIRSQIDEVEEFCDRLSEIAKSDGANVEDVQDFIPEENDGVQGPSTEPKILSTLTDFIEGPNLQSSIKKSSYLSKEFNDLSACNPQPMIKIFSENRRSLWKDKFKDMKKQSEDYSVESVTKMIDTLKFTLENSIYEPVA